MSTQYTGAWKPKTSVFISYAREDSAIAYALEAALLALGFAVLIDKTGIALGEDWQRRIEGMIRAADVVVFILSPDAVTSRVWSWEIARTEELKKRLLPIKWRSTEGLPLPPGLSRPNWGDFSEERDREELNERERRISQEKQRLVGEAARRARRPRDRSAVRCRHRAQARAGPCTAEAAKSLRAVAGAEARTTSAHSRGFQMRA
jgi:hypothetical protein